MKPVRSFAGCLLILLVLQTPSVAEGQFTNPGAISHWMQNYYSRPEPTLVPEAVKVMSRLKILKKPKAVYAVIGFLSGVLAGTPEIAPQLIEAFSKLPASQQPILVVAAQYSGLPDWREKMKAMASDLPKQKSAIELILGKETGTPDLMKIPLGKGPRVLDLLWGRFSATGRVEPVERVISALSFLEEKEDLPRRIIGGTAKWSLAANARQHSRVMEICKAQMERRSPPIKGALRDIVAVAETGDVSRFRRELDEAARDWKKRHPIK